MESIQCERSDGADGQIGVPVFLKPVSATHLLLSDQCLNASVCKISDETLPPGIFDDTVDPSLISNGPGATLEFPDHEIKTFTTNQDDVVLGSNSQTKTACSTWLCTPVQNINSGHFSMSITSPHHDKKDVTNITDTDPQGCKHDLSSRLPESESCAEKFDKREESKNSTFDMTKSLKEGSPGLNSTVALPCVNTDLNNITFESQEPKEGSAPGLALNSSVSTNNASLEGTQKNNLNSTVDICGPSSTTSGQKPNKLDCTVDISQSNVPKEEMCNERLTTHENCEKNGTYTKSAEENNAVDLTVDVGQNSSKSLRVSYGVGEPGSVTLQSNDRTFSKHNLTTDLTPSGPVSTLKHSTMNMLKTSNTELLTQSVADAGVVNDTPLFGSSCSASTAVAITVSAEPAVCSNRTLELPETENKAEEQQELFRRRNGISDGECLNLDISQSSMFSLDDTLDIKSRALVTSTPIVLGRGFDRLRSAKPIDMQQRLSVINSIDAQSNDDLVGVHEHDAVDASEPEPSSVKSEMCSQTQKVSPKSTLSSSPSETKIVNKPSSKLAVRRKIPQPKPSIPKTLIPPRPSTTQGTSLVIKSKMTPVAQAHNQPEQPSSTLPSLRKNIQLNKGKLGLAKNIMTASTVRTSSVVVSSNGCNLPADSKPSNPCMTQPKPSGLPPPGRGRVGLKPPGSVVFSGETGHSQTSYKPSGMRTRSSLLPGFAQKHASSDALPLAKRKKTDMQGQPVCAETLANSNAGGKAQRPITAAKGIQPEKTSADCENCTSLQNKLHTFHQELGGFLKELERIHADCENWMTFQQKFEISLERFRSLQAEHK